MYHTLTPRHDFRRAIAGMIRECRSGIRTMHAELFDPKTHPDIVDINPDMIDMYEGWLKDARSVAEVAPYYQDASPRSYMKLLREWRGRQGSLARGEEALRRHAHEFLRTGTVTP